MKFPPATPASDLQSWSPESICQWTRLTARVARVAEGDVPGSSLFELRTAVRDWFLSTPPEELDLHTAELCEPRVRRIIAQLWASDDDAVRATIRPAWIDAFQSQEMLGIVTTANLCKAFFVHAGTLSQQNPDIDTRLRELVVTALTRLPRRHRAASLVGTLAAQPEIVKDRYFPFSLARELLRTSSEPQKWFVDHHLTSIENTRFASLVRDVFFIERIRTADPEDASLPWLDQVRSEVQSHTKQTTPGGDGTLFGLTVMQSMTDHKTRYPSRKWFETLVAIGGDPRLTDTDKWRQWWGKLPKSNREQAIRWASGFALKDFLRALEEFATETGPEARRTFERRHRMLLGLYEQDRIDNVRIFLGTAARSWMLDHGMLRSLQYGKLTDSSRRDTTVICLDCGDFYLVEGSRSFPLYVFAPNKPLRLFDTTYVDLSNETLQQEVISPYERQYGQNAVLRKTHQGLWILDTLNFLKQHRVRVDERGLVSDEDYRDLVKRRSTR